jgi:hypothetical protein
VNRRELIAFVVAGIAFASRASAQRQVSTAAMRPSLDAVGSTPVVRTWEEQAIIDHLNQGRTGPLTMQEINLALMQAFAIGELDEEPLIPGYNDHRLGPLRAGYGTE